MYSFDARIRYSEIDESGKLSPAHVLDYFQDCSTFQTGDLGIDVSYLMEHHRGWILASYQIEFYRLPGCGDEVTVSTIPYEIKGPMGRRNFKMESKEGEVLALADSLWVFMDLEKGRMVKAGPEIAQIYELSDRLPMEQVSRKIEIPKDLTQQTSMPIRRADIDTNGHVNNVNYVRMALEWFPKELRLSKLRVEFKASALYGDTLIPYTKREGNVFYVRLENAAQEVCAVLQLTGEEAHV